MFIGADDEEDMNDPRIRQQIEDLHILSESVTERTH